MLLRNFQHSVQKTGFLAYTLAQCKSAWHSYCHILSLLTAKVSIESGKMLAPTLTVRISPTIIEGEPQCVQTKTPETSGWCTAKEQVAVNSSASVLYNNGNRVSRDWERF